MSGIVSNAKGKRRDQSQLVRKCQWPKSIPPGARPGGTWRQNFESNGVPVYGIGGTGVGTGWPPATAGTCTIGVLVVVVVVTPV